jgi:hypothetical protein
MQRLKTFGAMQELKELRKVPDLQSLEFEPVQKADNLTFSSHAWTITIDPVTGKTSACQTPTGCQLHCVTLSYIQYFYLECDLWHALSMAG